MKKLVHKLSYRPICETHSCNNAAEFGVGLDGFPATWTYYCKECFAIIVRDGMKLIDGDPDIEKIYSKLNAEAKAEEERAKEWEAKKKAEAARLEEIAELDRKRAEEIRKLSEEGSVTYGEKITEAKAEEIEKAAAELQELQEQSKKDFEAKNIQEKAKLIQEKAAAQAAAEAPKADEYYVCKKCGAKFAKPEDINLYRSHAINCGRTKGAKKNADK